MFKLSAQRLGMQNQAVLLSPLLRTPRSASDTSENLDLGLRMVGARIVKKGDIGRHARLILNTREPLCINRVISHEEDSLSDYLQDLPLVDEVSFLAT